VARGAGPGTACLTAARSLAAGGSVAASAGTGADAVRVGNSTAPAAIDGGVLFAVGGGVTIHPGAGDDQGAAVRALDPAAVLAIGGALSVVTAAAPSGTGRDDIRLLRVSVGQGTAITIATGADPVPVDDPPFGRPFSVTTGGGRDEVNGERAAPGGTARFRGAVRVSPGNGDDTGRAGTGVAAVQPAVFAAGRLWAGGPEAADRLPLLATGNLFFGPAAVTLGSETVT
jgi:hypothetical protein